jgi:hypothetical protein
MNSVMFSNNTEYQGYIHEVRYVRQQVNNRVYGPNNTFVWL